MAGKIACLLLILFLLSSGLIACVSSAGDSTAVVPTAVPTTMPTAQPTIMPTVRPTAVPTALPTYKPDMGIFETVWQTVADGFYDASMNGVDWRAMYEQYAPQVASAGDAESYYRLINGMLFELGVSHIGLLPPSMADELDPITFPAGSLGFDARLLEEQIVVTMVQADSPAESAGLRPGYVINQVNGLTVSALAQESIETPALNERDRRGLISQAVRAELYGEPGKTVTISFLDGSDQSNEVTLSYAPRPGKRTEIMPDLPPAHIEFTSYRLSPEIAYMSFSGFLKRFIWRRSHPHIKAPW
jgi:C-terminal processing protease CtpA/Prc